MINNDVVCDMSDYNNTANWQHHQNLGITHRCLLIMKNIKYTAQIGIKENENTIWWSENKGLHCWQTHYERMVWWLLTVQAMKWRSNTVFTFNCNLTDAEMKLKTSFWILLEKSKIKSDYNFLSENENIKKNKENTWTLQWRQNKHLRV